MPAPSKRDKQSVKRGAHNKGVRTRLRNLSKSFYRAVESGDEGEARRIRDESQREYNKAAGKGIIHPNRAARKVSRLDKALAANRSEQSSIPKLDEVVPWGRSKAEYVRMFALIPGDLLGKILDCASGPSSFNAELTAEGPRVTSCDPL